MGYIELAKDVLKLASHNLRELGKLSLHDLQSVKDMGEAIATLIAAALEIGRRREVCLPLGKVYVRSSTNIANYLKVQMTQF